MIKFDELVTELRKVAPLGHVTVVSYAGLKIARELGIDIISDYAGTLCCQNLIHDIGSKDEQNRIRAMWCGYPW
jgi:hypothetical protein